MNITIIGSGWLALPLAQQLTENRHQVTVTSTTAEKTAQLTSQGYQALTYQMGQDLPVAMHDADVLIIANTCKDVSSYQHTFADWPADNLPQIIYTSSTAVYQDNGQIHNETSTGINTEHPTYLIEQILSPLNANIIRLSGLVGPKRHPGRFFSKSLTVKNPKNPVNLIHLNDAIGLINTVIEHKAESNSDGQIFNGCADNHPSKGDYYSHMAQMLNGISLSTSQETTSLGKTICNKRSKSIYHYKHPDVWHMPF